ncbi:hypothetical protein MKW98_000121 [Papaver atlanticum]|uniref:BHLH domain-containing protein n=1 Tax=Papaver atlanticum TaxID=357466 RepID=A0AAD4SQH5_9MAGN|nr:hypothetical protein MKW98_000121 [Papaver atlanticum]
MGFNGGGGESNRGLTRFWSAPATWLDTLIQPDDDVDDGEGRNTTTNPISIPKPQQPKLTPPLPPSSNLPPQIPTLSRNNSASINYIASSAAASPVTNAFFDSTATSGGDLGFLRQNSSPAELLARLTSLPASVGSDGFLSSYGGSGNYEYNLSSCLDFPSNNNNKRSRDSDFQQESPKISPHPLKGEQSGDYGNFGDMEMEKLFEDSVPCRVRAKRGCATHPRSIAERVRRTRISDRIRKLQELVPNMDKQTNTADMLEEAVEYVKLLQKQIQELSEHQQNCKCLVRG